MSRLEWNKMMFYVTFFLSLNFLRAEKYIERQIVPPPSLSKNEVLLKYLKLIESVTAYCGKNIGEIDIHLAYGLFLTVVNYELSIKDYSSKIPADMTKRLKTVIKKLKDLIQRYKSFKYEVMARETRQILKLFSNSTVWIQHVKKIKYDEPDKYSTEDLLNIYSTWEQYLKDVDEVNFSKPTPDESDLCMVSLSINPTNYKNSISWCTVADTCYSLFYSGTNFGYALCHRILLLQMARYGRACALLSVQEDDNLMGSYCKMAYAEAEYIARNNYEVQDLIMEIICVCAMNGQGEFLNPIWLESLLRFQSSRGCFGKENKGNGRSLDEPFFWRGSSLRRRRRRNICNSHTTGVAAGIYSTAIRYIIQKH